MPNPNKTAVADPDVEVIRSAAEQGKLAYRDCAACSEPHYYPRPLCPFCLSSETRWRQSSGNGTVYSYSVSETAEGPHILAYVTLAEGVSLLTNIVECDPDRVATGLPVELVFRNDEAGIRQPCFRPTMEGA